jgi:hypothetical protein
MSEATGPRKASEVEVDDQEAVERDRRRVRDSAVRRRVSIQRVREEIAAGRRKPLFPELDRGLRTKGGR